MQEKTVQDQKQLRPPIVTILGHVDHGKTSLLDYIRETSVAQRESGGITQKIGASVVVTKEGKKITFIDTPGHAAFEQMRGRGAKVADIAVLVVSAVDGVKPQTKEALNHIISAKIPYIVAATKVDLPTADTGNVKRGLEKEGILFENTGGEVPLVAVSSKTGVGVSDLLEMINLVSELHNVNGDPNASLEAVVIETGKDKKGLTANVVVRNGTLKVGSQIISETVKCKVRGLFDDHGVSIKSVGPGEPCQVIGFEELPPVGSRIWDGDGNTQLKPQSPSGIQEVIQPGDFKLKLLVKATSAGSLEAVIGGLPPEVYVVQKSVGDVTESDIFLAKSSNAMVFVFEAKVAANVTKLADTEAVKVETFTIIYKLFERVDELLKGQQVEIIGRAQILASFPFENRKVAGCKVLNGVISKTDSLRLTRGEKELGNIKVISMKKGKVDVESVKQGEEFGLIFVPQLDFVKGDVVISVRK